MKRLALIALIAGCGARRMYPHDGGLVGQLEAEVIALKFTNRQLREDVRTCGDGSQRSETYPTLVQVFQETEVEVTQEGSHLVLRMPMDFVYADPFTLRYRDEASREIDLIATALRLNYDQPVEVHGFTDDNLLSPEAARLYRTHSELSYHQAASLMERLVREFHIGAERFVVIAHGSNDPIAPNATVGGQTANRRLEVHLLPPELE